MEGNMQEMEGDIMKMEGNMQGKKSNMQEMEGNMKGKEGQRFIKQLKDTITIYFWFW